MRFLSLLTLGLALGLAACDSADPGVSSGASADVPLAGAAAKSDVCHYDADNDTYHLINVADAAIDAHIEHGDAAPGEAVPTQEGYFFDGECEPRRAVVADISCPDALTAGTDGAFTGSVNADAYAPDPLDYAFDFEGDATAEATGTFSPPSVDVTYAYTAAGTYEVTFTATGPFNASSDTCSVEVIAAGPAPAAIGDFVFEDLNQNGIQDAGEPGIEGAYVQLLEGNGIIPIDFAYTDANGNYLFDGLPSGEYVIRFRRLPGWDFTSRNVGADDTVDTDVASDGRTGVITLASGEVDLTWDAGMRPPY